MTELNIIELLAGRMEWLVLTTNSQSPRPIDMILLSHSAVSICVAVATLVMSWILVDRSLSFTQKYTGEARLGFAGHAGIIFFFLSLAPASDPASWAALFGAYEQQLARLVLDAAIPSISTENSYLTSDVRASFEAAAIRMGRGLAAQEASYNFMSIIAGVFALHSTLVKSNEFIRRKSPFWIFAGGCLIFYAVASLTRPELSQALLGRPEAYLLKYLGMAG
jgi:hypothetical protein